MELHESVRDLLDRIEPRRLGGGDSSQAAVLMGIMVQEKQAAFLLTRRTETVATHKGQISFPGGVREAADRSLIETALRETLEEIGVESSEVEILGEFHDYLAITDHIVRPVIGIVRPRGGFNLQEEEVSYLLKVPLKFFQTSEPVIRQRVHRGRTHEVYYFDYNGEIIWGLTARMIKDLVDLLPLEPEC